MISQPYRKGLSITSLIFILSLIFISCHCDCPIARYRSEFKLGQAKVVQTQSVANQLTAQNFSFILDAPLLKSNPLIFIGLTGFSYTLANNSVNFQIVDAKDPSLVSLSFTLSSKGSVESNRIWSFRFLAIQKKYSIIDGGTFRSLGDTSIVSRKVGVNDLSSDNYDVAVFINGIVASSQSPLSSLSIQLTNCKIDKGILSFEMKKSSDTIKIQSISYSLLSYNKAQFQGQNQALLKPIQFNSLSPALNLPLQQSLLHSDLTFFGLSMITFDSSTTSILDISMDNKLDTDGVKFTVSATYSRPFEMLVWQTHVKDPYLCSFCKNSPIMFENRYCVGTCPKDYIAQAGQYMLECKKCPIEQFRVPDYKTNKCVCSLQYFENLQTNLCAPCHYTCITCMGEGSNQCLTCQVNPKVKNTFRQFVKDSSNSLTGKCICPAGYLEIDQVITCEACHPDCRTCSGPAQTDCIECNKQRQMNQFGVCQCKAGYTSQSDGSCVCFNPRFQSNGACVDPLNACGPNQVLVTQNLKNNNKNKAITSSCECKTGLYRIKGQCSTCGPNQEYNARKGLCSCTKQSNQLKNGTCLLCPVGKKFNKETESCICKNKNQLENSKGECVSCPTKSIFYNDECVCIFNYFMNEKGKCQKCKKSTDNPQCRKQTGNQL